MLCFDFKINDRFNTDAHHGSFRYSGLLSRKHVWGAKSDGPESDRLLTVGVVASGNGQTLILTLPIPGFSNGPAEGLARWRCLPK